MASEPADVKPALTGVGRREKPADPVDPLKEVSVAAASAAPVQFNQARGVNGFSGRAAGEMAATAGARCWQAGRLAPGADVPVDARVCATIWPTRALQSPQRWFDELYLWTEGFHASTMQRARIQSAVLQTALRMLERERVQQIGVTLSFGTVERLLDDLVDAFALHELIAHRVVVVLRGAFERLRSRYRLRIFRDHLRSQHASVGYLLTASSASMERKSLDFLQPDFAKLTAPKSARAEFWQDLLLEARVAGAPDQRMIVAGLDTPEQLAIARQSGIAFGQGKAVRSAFIPASL
jgi:hypothetical protein